MKLNPEMQSYFKGYKQCLENFEERINHSIVSHDNARTPADVIEVFNDIIDFINTQHLDLRRVEAPPQTEKTFYVVVDNSLIQ